MTTTASWLATCNSNRLISRAVLMISVLSALLGRRPLLAVQDLGTGAAPKRMCSMEPAGTSTPWNSSSCLVVRVERPWVGALNRIAVQES